MRAVIEAAFKTKVTEALIQKYVEVEFEKHDTDKSGTIGAYSPIMYSNTKRDWHTP